MYEFLESIQFFTPSSELTKEIVDFSHVLAIEDSHNDLYNVEEAFNENLMHRHEAEHDWQTPDEMRAFVNNLDQESFPQKLPYSPEELRRIHKQNQLIVAERLYGFLAILARRPQSLAGRRYDIREIIPDGMGILLGFSKPSAAQEFRENQGAAEGLSQMNDDSAKLLMKLTGEFERWLGHECRGHYKAPWGEMLLEREYYLLLIANTFSKPEPNQSYTRATYTPVPSEAYYNRKTRKA